MADYVYAVTVTADTEEQAAQVMAERINVDEDYGFEYTIGFEPMEEMLDDGEPIQIVITSSGVVCGGCGITLHARTETDGKVTCVICGHRTEAV